MQLKFCNDNYGFNCENYADTTNTIELSNVFRLVKTHTGHYYRNVCKQCEAKQRKKQRKNRKYKKTNHYDWWDYGQMF